MNRIILAIILIFVLFITGCQLPISDPSQGSSKKVESNTSTVFEQCIPPKSISINSLAELEEMREMIACTDEEKLATYLSSVMGGGANSIQDLEHFVKLMDSLPYVAMINGEITWLNYAKAQTIDDGADYEVAMITITGENGDWIRMEYILSETDVSGRIEMETDQMTSSSSLFTPIQSADNRMKVYSETREDHPSGTGDLIRWIAEIDGLLLQVVYYTNDGNTVVTNELFDSIEVSSLQR